MPSRSIRGYLRLLVLAALVVAAALLSWSIGESKIFGECIKHTKNEEGYQPLNQDHATVLRILSRLRLNVACVGVFADQKQGAISAVATVFIAIFTIILGIATVFLWRATDKLVREADDTATRQLRAYVHLENITAFKLATGPEPKIQNRLKNFGQTPAREITVTYKYASFNSTNMNFGLNGVKRGEIADLAPKQHDHFVIAVHDLMHPLIQAGPKV